MAPGARTLCLWCPDWPVVALRNEGRVPDREAVVVFEGGRVRAASVEARAHGVRSGLRRREAEARCPQATMEESDPAVEARAFEPVARALDTVTPRVALERPGLLSFPLRGPARYFRSEEAVVEQVRDAVSAIVDDGRVAVATGTFTALLAVRQTSADRSTVMLSDEESRAFLAQRPVRVLEDRGWRELARLLRRLGVRTLGDLAALPAKSVATRFGPEGVAAHRLARGLDVHPTTLSDPPPELAETGELDPPAERVDAAAFAAKGLADRLLERLAQRGLVCTRVVVEAETEHGERFRRVWSHRSPFTAGALAQRVRWQLDAWLSEREARSPTGGLTLLRLVPDELVPATGHQLGFWGADPRAGDRAARVLTRLQGMLGPEAVLSPVLRGGRTPAEQVIWVPWNTLLGSSRQLEPGETDQGSRGQGPYPGRIPPPAPARVFDPPLAAELVDATGAPVRVSGRGEVSAPPARLDSGVVRGRVRQWGGPWVHDVRWWDERHRRRRALFQVEVEGGVAGLVSLEGGRTYLTALYD